MSDDFGNLLDAGASLTAGEVGAAYGAYKAYGRVQPFVQGAINAGQGAMLGADIAKVAGSGIVKRAAGQAIAKAAVATGVRAGVTAAATSAAAGGTSGAVAGMTAGTAIAPGVGTAIGLVAGAVAPFIIPHIPVVGDAINKIPVIGGILSPDKEKKEESYGVLGSGVFQEQASQHLQSPGQNVMANRADYQAGRGFRRL